jgi:hypothetical protein
MGINNDIRIRPLDHRCEFFHSVPDYDPHITHSRFPKQADDPLNDCLIAQRQKGLKPAHTRGKAGRENDS